MKFSEKWTAPLGGLLLATAAGAICAWLSTPLPWMIGPLFAVAGARLAGVHVTAVPGARYTGQWIIGSALGLYFTPMVVKQVLSFAPWMLMAGVYALCSAVREPCCSPSETGARWVLSLDGSSGVWVCVLILSPVLLAAGEAAVGFAPWQPRLPPAYSTSSIPTSCR